MAAMAYAGALPFLQSAWGMKATSAGGIQSAYNLSNALALLVASWLTDRFGARRVYLVSSVAGALAMVNFATFARSHDSALWTIIFLAFTQGASYNPALLFASEMSSTEKRGMALGGLLAAGSFGYLLSVLMSLCGATLVDYRFGFALCAIGTVIGALLGVIALRSHPDITYTRKSISGDTVLRVLCAPAALLLTVWYIAHCWELLGSWAWTPTFLTRTLNETSVNPLFNSLLVACAVHLAGTVSTLVVGAISDRYQRSTVLMVVALVGATLSMTLGWSSKWGGAPVVALAFAASFFILGDSGVLSAAITEAAPPQYLGRILGIRSILGFGIGSLSPLSFGIMLDATKEWGWAYFSLGVGGFVAVCAAMSPAP
jgi:MFS family permease